ncbi:hypothetical protein TSAR_006241 [Trichomalopsis sarcophagae]|uniref:Uncharacterized protein n=1 Tax=Trichomalopsis sarcophagae TaxID=543379 RepID=A0A232EGC6_9HYME|nr:hypothetical protein TSAR_006241 [Trichomalopsis sarcophagae]
MALTQARKENQYMHMAERMKKNSIRHADRILNALARKCNFLALCHNLRHQQGVFHLTLDPFAVNVHFYEYCVRAHDLAGLVVTKPNRFVTIRNKIHHPVSTKNDSIQSINNDHGQSNLADTIQLTNDDGSITDENSRSISDEDDLYDENDNSDYVNDSTDED